MLQVVEEKEERELRVPLPPSFGYQLNESDDEEEEGPPGMTPIKMPAIQKKVQAPYSLSIYILEQEPPALGFF